MVGPGETAALAAARWIRGAPDGSTFLIRQGQPVSVAALFLYLLPGSEVALLHDTGATAEGG